ncbi:MAG TPA: hypothetical protein VMS17_03690 [Gemmataceae bacterium]|nr:hypothetical protein [Gemmataceae bacterium]
MAAPLPYLNYQELAMELKNYKWQQSTGIPFTPFYVQIVAQAGAIADSYIVCPWGFLRLGSASSITWTKPVPDSAGPNKPTVRPYQDYCIWTPPGWFRFNVDLPKLAATWANGKYVHITRTGDPRGPVNSCYGFVYSVVKWLMQSPQLQDTEKGVELVGSWDNGRGNVPSGIRVVWNNAAGELLFTGMPSGFPKAAKCPFTNWQYLREGNVTAKNEFGLNCTIGFSGVPDLWFEITATVPVAPGNRQTTTRTGAWPN